MKLTLLFIPLLLSSCGAEQGIRRRFPAHENSQQTIENYCVIAIGDGGRSFHLATLPVTEANRLDYYNYLKFYNEYYYSKTTKGNLIDQKDYQALLLDPVAKELKKLYSENICHFSQSDGSPHAFKYHCRLIQTKESARLELRNQAPGGGWLESLFEYSISKETPRTQAERIQKLKSVQEFFVQNQICDELL